VLHFKLIACIYCQIFTARRYDSTVYAVIVFVCPSVTRWYCTKTANHEHKITQTTPCDSPGTLVF